MHQRQEAYTDADVLQLALKAIAAIEERGEKVSQVKISAEVGMSLAALKTYPSVYGLLTQMKLDRQRRRMTAPCRPRWDRNDPLMTRVRQVIADMRTEGVPVTRKEAMHRLGVGGNVIKRRPLLWQYIDEQRQLDRQRREEQILLNVQKAIDTLNRRGEKVSIRTVSGVTGYSVEMLKTRPQIQTSLAVNEQTV